MAEIICLDDGRVLGKCDSPEECIKIILKAGCRGIEIKADPRTFMKIMKYLAETLKKVKA